MLNASAAFAESENSFFKSVFFILNTETNYTQFCGPCALVSPNFKHSSQFEIKFKKKYVKQVYL